MRPSRAERVFDFLTGTTDGVLAVDTRQRIVLWNTAARMILGFDAREVLGKLCYEVLGGTDDTGCLVCRERCVALQRAVRSRLTHAQHLQIHTKDGGKIWASVSTLVLPSRWRGPFDPGAPVSGGGRPEGDRAKTPAVVTEPGNHFAGARAETTRAPPTPCWLSPPHTPGVQVLGLLAGGTSTKAIAEELFISPLTARNHILNIMAKLSAHSRLEAVTIALRWGWI